MASSISHLCFPLCFQMNAVAEIFEAVQGFTCLSYSKNSKCWLAWSKLDWMPCGWAVSLAESFPATGDTHSGQFFAPLPCKMRRDHCPVMLDTSGQSLDHSLPFFFFLFTLLNCGDKAQGDFLRWRLSLPVARPTAPNLIYCSMTS